MRGYLLLIACFLAGVMFVTLGEGKSIAEAEQKHESEDNADEREEQNVEDLSGSGSGSGAGTHKLTSNFAVTDFSFFSVIVSIKNSKFSRSAKKAN